MSLALTRYEEPNALSFEQRLSMAEQFAAAGVFQDVRGAAQCLVKIQAGAELGFPAFASMQGIHMIQGKPTIGGQMFKALIDADPNSELVILEWTDTLARGFIRQRSKLDGKVIDHPELAYSLKDAERQGLAGKDNWKKFPRQMLYWRLVSNLARMFLSGRCMGLYLPDEINPDIKVNDQGEIIDVPSYPVAPPVETVPEPKHEAKPRSAEPKQEPEQQPLVDLPALRKQFIAAWKAAKLKPNPAVVAKILNLSEMVAADCFDEKGGLKIKDLSEDELQKLIRYAAQGSEEKPAEPEDRNPFADDEEGAGQ